MRLWQAGPVWGYTATPARHAALAAAPASGRDGRAVCVAGRRRAGKALPGHARQGEAVRQLATRWSRCGVVLVSTTGSTACRAASWTRTPLPDTDARPKHRRGGGGLPGVGGRAGVVMRLGGLYGPGRGPGAALARRSAASGPANRTLPLIHYDDAAAAIVASSAHGRAGALLSRAVTPPCPTRGDLYRAAHACLGLGEPQV
ncbi:MAG: hypothetical protein R2854_11080 [Caldilineaceae bacterium]